MLLTTSLLSLQSCPTLCDPIDGSPPGSSVPGILQARTLEWVAISCSNAWKWKVKGKSLSRVRLCNPVDYSLPGSSVHGICQARVLEWGAIAFSNYIPMEWQILFTYGHQLYNVALLRGAYGLTWEETKSDNCMKTAHALISSCVIPVLLGPRG